MSNHNPNFQGDHLRQAKLRTKGERVFIVHRSLSSIMDGCHGHFTVELNHDENGQPHAWGQVPIEDIVGRQLGDGTNIKVTVEVIKEGEPLESKKNPWHGKRKPYNDCPCNEKELENV